jgi:hypothetical protein
MKKSQLTIIDDKNLRGVLAPSSLVSKEVFEDIIDLIELSSPTVAKETEKRLKEAHRKNSWVPFAKVYARAKKAR